MAQLASSNIRDSAKARVVKNIAAEDFQSDVDQWCDIADQLPPYDEASIRKELSEWDVSLPDKDCLEPAPFQEVYSRHVAYRDRLVALLDLVRTHSELFQAASKALEKTAYGLSNGKTQKDKEAFASHVVNGFVSSSYIHKTFYGHLVEWRDMLDYSTMQLARILRHHEALARHNEGHKRDGDAAYADRQKKSDGSYLPRAPLDEDDQDISEAD